MNNVTPTAAGRQAAGCPSVKGGGWLSVESQGSFFKDEGNMLKRIWRKLVALNHCRDIYGEDTLVTQGIQLTVGLLTAYGILKFIGLWDAVFH
jgi:hypothetical protein